MTSPPQHRKSGLVCQRFCMSAGARGDQAQRQEARVFSCRLAETGFPGDAEQGQWSAELQNGAGTIG